MKLHQTAVDFLVKVYEVNSGWSEERKLKEALRHIDFSIYTQQDGTQVIVSTKELNEAKKRIEQELNNRRGR